MRPIEGDKFAWCKVIAIAHLVHFVAEVAPSQWGPTWLTRQCYHDKCGDQKTMYIKVSCVSISPKLWTVEHMPAGVQLPEQL